MTLLQGAHFPMCAQPDSDVPELTRAERRVAALLIEGLSNVEIADRLCVSRNTVKAHVRHVLAKLGARNRVQAAVVIMRIGIASYDG